MSERTEQHLRTNVVGYIAIFLFAIGGTAYATHPGGANTISSDDIINGEVKAVDIGTGELTSADILNGTVEQPGPRQRRGRRPEHPQRRGQYRPKVANDSLTGADVARTTASTASTVDDLTGLDIANGSLGGADVAERQPRLARGGRPERRRRDRRQPDRG